MRYAIISDIHSNLEALKAVLEDVGQQHVDKYICLGDIVGYGADPNECIQHIQRLTEHVVVGNHDHAAVGLSDISYFNAHARQAVMWTSKVLLSEHSRYLSSLPFTQQMNDLFFVMHPLRPTLLELSFLSPHGEDRIRHLLGPLLFHRPFPSAGHFFAERRQLSAQSRGLHLCAGGKVHHQCGECGTASRWGCPGLLRYFRQSGGAAAVETGGL